MLWQSEIGHTFNLKCQCYYYIGLEYNSTFKLRLGIFVSFSNLLNDDSIVLRYESLTLIGHGIDTDMWTLVIILENGSDWI